MHHRTSVATLGALIALVAGCAKSAPKTAPAPAARPAGAPTDSAARPGGPAAPRTGPKPYKDVITAKAKSDPGAFTVHQVGDKWYYEIPRAMLGREFIVVSRIAQTAAGLGYGGTMNGANVVRWVRTGDKVYLRQVSFSTVADSTKPIAQAVRNSNAEPIIAGFDVAAYGADSTVVVDVTPLYTTDVAMLGLPSFMKTQYQIRRLDPARTFLESIHSYPKNLETRVVMTYDAGAAPSNASTGSITIVMNHSMLLLPVQPMQPRLMDSRVGYFGVQQTDYGRDEDRVVRRRFISRWRLEPKDTAAFLRGELVEPIKQIVYYIDPATPEKWVPYLIQGVNDWQAAFEAAGFKNAIIAKRAPTPAEDPEFSLDDARYSVIRYLASDVENASGPHVPDPRSGEILETHIQWYHNVMNLLRNWYLIQTAAINPNARMVDFDDKVMGELIRFVSSHEVGHTLGLPHNMKASSSYPVDSLRSPTFTAKYATAPSIMDYARFNYVAQPGDGAVAMNPRIGVYDKYSISWGYRPIIGAKTPDDEKATLDQWIKLHENDPMYRFGDPSGTDPGSQTEDLGDDGVKAGRYGIMNLKRIMPKLMEWSYEKGADYAQLNEMYGQVGAQWQRYMGHVLTIVGGVDYTRKNMDQVGGQYTPITEARQREAVRFLTAEALQTPTWMIDEAIFDRVGVLGATDRIKGYMTGVMSQLLQNARLTRLAELQALGTGTYTPAELMADVRTGVWTELSSGKAPDAYRRTLQRAWIDRLGSIMNPPAPPAGLPAAAAGPNVSQSDLQALARVELATVRSQLAAAGGKGDAITRAHYADAAARIKEILEPRK
ncbi:MAG: zinc-dependent metalloprotease [Gemmatimonadetes bacterium]|nr:zinc-dependent metalloprotease [Gemmatimonadota bacterium]